MEPPRPYFSERAGRSDPGAASERSVRTALQAAFARFEREGYLQGAFGKQCVDAGWMPGSLGMTLEDHLVLRFGEERGPRLEPTAKNFAGMELDDLFDLIEYLHDHLAKPIKSSVHQWDGCGVHVSKSDPNLGRQEWRAIIDPLLARMQPPYRLTAEGIIELLPTAPGVKELVDVPLETDRPEEVDKRVSRASARFFARHATLDDQRDAIRELVDVLEYLRKELKEELTKADEADLFRIANQYAIRHHDGKQIQGYDRAEMYPWIFHVYLATIHMMSTRRASRNGVEARSSG